MGKKRSVSKNVSVQDPAPATDESKIELLKKEGNNFFALKNYVQAIEVYDKAIKATKNSSEEAYFHSNKAVCHIMQQRYKDAIKDCTSALSADPNHNNAYIRRSKAYEAMGLYKQALSDIQKAVKRDEDNTELQDLEKRLKLIVAGKGRQVVSADNQFAGGHEMFVFLVKCKLEGEVRVLHILGQTSYAELLEQVHSKFPNTGPVLLKYLDRDGDYVTLTNKHDVGFALDNLVNQAQENIKYSGASRRLQIQRMLAPLQLQLVKVNSEEEVPQPPEEEVQQLKQISDARQLIRQKNKENAERKSQEQCEIDQWLIDFAILFRDSLGIEPDKHLDLSSVAWEQLQAALDTTVMNEKSEEYFNKASNKFQEVAAHAMLQWGNVHLCEGKRAMDRAAFQSIPLTKVAAEVESFFSKAEDRYREALKIKSNYYDGAASLANLAFERGKLAANFVIMPTKPQDVKEGAEKEADASKDVAKGESGSPEVQPYGQEVLIEALEKLTAADLKKGQSYFKQTWKHFQEAIDMLPEEEKNKPLDPNKDPNTNDDDESNVWAQCQVMWGNLLYELSQMEAAVKEDWKKTLDEATGRFRSAGCPEADIRAALKSHYKKEEIDLGPDPEEANAEAKEKNEQSDKSVKKSTTDSKTAEKKAEPAPATQAGNKAQGKGAEPAKAKAAETKGLPSLQKKKGNKK